MSNLETLQSAIERLASLDRGSCTPGEREAAEWIAGALRARGVDVRVEHERVHGTYWWPLGLSSALGILAARQARRGRRFTGAGLAAVALAAIVDDLDVRWRLLRRLLPKGVTANVIAEAGDRSAERALLLIAHHDAAHTSVFFNPALTSRVGRYTGQASARRSRVPPPMAPVAAAPALIGVASLLGVRRLALAGGLICGGIIASFAEMANRRTVPGANDNLTGVATLLGVAAQLQEQPVEGLRVVLVSTGAEESLMEGMRAFWARHSQAFADHQARVLCVDTVGSSHLVLGESEGLLRVRTYDPGFKDLVEECAGALGVRLRRGVRMQFATDGYVALRQGVSAALLTSVEDSGIASNYHRPTDTPDRVNYERVADAVAICDAVVRRIAAGPA